MVRLRWFVVILALALVCGSAAQADTNYMPTMQREQPGVAVRAHVVWGDGWYTVGRELSGYRIAAYDCDGAELGAGVTDGEGSAYFEMQPAETVVIRMEGDEQVPAQSVTVEQGDAPLAVAFWLSTKYSRDDAQAATNWARAECGRR